MFDFSYFHVVEKQTSEAGINKALDMWAASVLEYDGEIPWSNAWELYDTIDAIQLLGGLLNYAIMDRYLKVHRHNGCQKLLNSAPAEMNALSLTQENKFAQV